MDGSVLQLLHDAQPAPIPGRPTGAATQSGIVYLGFNDGSLAAFKRVRSGESSINRGALHCSPCFGLLRMPCRL